MWADHYSHIWFMLNTNTKRLFSREGPQHERLHCDTEETLVTSNRKIIGLKIPGSHGNLSGLSWDSVTFVTLIGFCTRKKYKHTHGQTHGKEHIHTLAGFAVCVCVYYWVVCGFLWSCGDLWADSFMMFASAKAQTWPWGYGWMHQG